MIGETLFAFGDAPSALAAGSCVVSFLTCLITLDVFVTVTVLVSYSLTVMTLARGRE